MNNEILIAILSFLGTAAGSITSIMTANKLTNYKIEQLKEEVKKHNGLIDRVYKLEERAEVTEERIKVANHRIDDLEAQKGGKK